MLHLSGSGVKILYAYMCLQQHAQILREYLCLLMLRGFENKNEISDQFSVKDPSHKHYIYQIHRRGERNAKKLDFLFFFF